MDFSSSDTDWIWALKDGSSVSSDSLTADLQIHSQQGAFNFDLTKARGGNSLNPFVSEAATATAAGGSAPSSGSSAAGQQQSGTSTSGSSGSSSSSSSGGSGGGGYAGGSGGGGYAGGSGGGGYGGSAGAYASIAANFAKRNKSVIAHGTTMGLAFALLFPSGSLLIRLFSFKGLVWVHAAFQMFAYALSIIGLGLGVYISVWPSQVKDQHFVRLDCISIHD